MRFKFRVCVNEGGGVDFEIVDLGDVSSSGKTIQSREMAWFIAFRKAVNFFLLY